jgi:2-polyprenyl-3-methyl-5-hydroxy-6-metoxy-1,4-benzoquinol methylase
MKRLQTYDTLRPFLLNRFKDFFDAEILHVGCGNSSNPFSHFNIIIGFSEFLYKDGFKNITNIDFSFIIIQEMNEKYKAYDEMDCKLISMPINFS